MKSTRRSFVALITTSVAAAAGVSLLGCGDDGSDDDGTGGATGTGGTTGTGGSTGTGGGTSSASGGGGMGGSSAGACATNGTANTIGSNHGHELTVPAADVIAGTEKIYDITGTSDHPHTVMLTAAHFAQLHNDEVITVVSTTDASHSHDVTVQCA